MCSGDRRRACPHSQVEVSTRQQVPHFGTGNAQLPRQRKCVTIRMGGTQGQCLQLARCKHRINWVFTHIQARSLAEINADIGNYFHDFVQFLDGDLIIFENVTADPCVDQCIDQGVLREHESDQDGPDIQKAEDQNRGIQPSLQSGDQGKSKKHGSYHKCD
jgi:hypothetical protein